jgi:hypothetical protein
MVLQSIISFVAESVVKAAIARLVGMLVPGGAFIQAILTIYDTVMVFVQRLSQIAQVVAAFIDGIAAIAGGAIAAAAKRVESVMAGLLSLVVAFLAKFAGLGKVTDKIVNLLKKVQGKVDAAIDFAINWVVTKAKAFLAALTGKGKGKDKKEERTPEQKQQDLDKALIEADAILQDKQTPLKKLKSKLGAIKSKYKMTSLEFKVVTEDKAEGTETVQVEGEINPKGSKPPKPHNLKELVASINPINYRYRGCTVTYLSGPLKGKSVAYDSLGFPDFEPYSIKKVTIKMHGNRSYREPDGDFGNANVKAGYARNGGEPSTHTWHHHQDRRTMLLIDTKIHDGFRHSGGVWVIDQLGEKD